MSVLELKDLLVDIDLLKNKVNKLLEQEEQPINEKTINTEYAQLKAILNTSKMFTIKELEEPQNKWFLSACNNYLTNYGLNWFVEVVARVEIQGEHGTIKNKYAYMLKSLERESNKKSTLPPTK